MLRKTGLDIVDECLDWLNKRVEELRRIPIGRGRLITVVLPDGEQVNVPHGLQRRYQGWHVVDTTVQASSGRIGRVLVTHNETKVLPLQADGWGADITVTLWVF